MSEAPTWGRPTFALWPPEAAETGPPGGQAQQPCTSEKPSRPELGNSASCLSHGWGSQKAFRFLPLLRALWGGGGGLQGDTAPRDARELSQPAGES